ncbi:MAG TPA: phosphotransferase [Gemmatimonadaceae bacterium]|nr:phosphotransferase [Gemmatimonadaceae bacterium]
MTADALPAGAGWMWPALEHDAGASLLRAHLPEADLPLIAVGAGDDSLAFRAGRRILRLARHAESAAGLAREACALGMIADRLPLPVPRPSVFRPPDCPPFAMHQEVAGEVLTREAWLRLPGPDREATAVQLAEFLVALHAIPPADVQRCGLPRIDASEMVRTARTAMGRVLSPLLSAEGAPRLEAFLATWPRPDEHGAREVLLHADLAPGHVLYDPDAGRLTGIIDFGDLSIGDAARDFIYLYEDFGMELLTAVAARYAGDAAPRLVERARRWYVLEAIVWTIEMHTSERVAQTRHGLNEIERELAGV